MAQYIIGPVECTGTYNDPNLGPYHPFSGRVVLEETVDELANESTIQWYFQIYINRDYYQSTWRFQSQNKVWVNIKDTDNDPVYKDFYSANIGTVAMGGHYINNPVTLASGTITGIKHEDDGTKTIHVYAKFQQPQANDTVLKSIEISADQALTPIPRAASIISAPNVTLPVSGTVNHTVTWDINSPSFYYKVQYLVGSTPVHTSDALHVGTYTYAMPASLSEYETAAKSMELLVVLHTYSDAECTDEVGVSQQYIYATFSDDYAPTLTYTAAPNNDSIPSGSRSAFAGLFIQYTSRLALTLTGTGSHGATITGYTCFIDSKGYSGASVLTDPIETSGNVYGTATISDSRGFYTTVSFTLSVIAYTYPKLLPYGSNDTILAYRVDQYGQADDEGTSIMVEASSQSSPVMSGSTNINKAHILVRYYDGSSWSFPDDIEASSGDASINFTIPGTFPATNAYTVEIWAQDRLGYSSGRMTIKVPTADLPFHLRRGGHGVGIGRAASSTADRLMIGYETYHEMPIHASHGGLAISTQDIGNYTMAGLWDAVKNTPGGTGVFGLTEAFGNMSANDYTYVYIPCSSTAGIFYFSLLDSDTGELWIVHVFQSTIRQPWKLTGSR